MSKQQVEMIAAKAHISDDRLTKNAGPKHITYEPAQSNPIGCNTTPPNAAPAQLHSTQLQPTQFK